MPSCLITGATGYVGSHVANALCDTGVQVHALVRNTLQIYRLDPRLVCHPYTGEYAQIARVFESHSIDTVIHLAAFSGAQIVPEKIAALVEANLTLGMQLLDAMSFFSCKQFINTSSYWQYDEVGMVEPKGLYALTKQLFETTLDYYTDIQAMRVISLTLMDVYGPNDKRPKLFSQLAQAVKTNAAIALTLGEQHLNLVYIDDVVAAYLHALDLLTSARGHTRYFVASDEQMSLREIVTAYLDKTGSQLIPRWGALPYRENTIWRPYVGERLPGWQAGVSFMTGLSRIV